MTDVLEPLRRLIERCNASGNDWHDLMADDAEDILGAYSWQSLADLGNPVPVKWPWDGSWVIGWDPTERIAGHTPSVVMRWKFVTWRWESRGRDGHEPTHVRPLDPPPPGDA